VAGVLGATSGSTNGAAMRALSVGWGVPAGADDERREAVLALSRATHGAPGALIAAGVIAAIGSWSLEGAAVDTIWEGAVAEAVRLREVLGADVPLDGLAAAVEDRWEPPAVGISLDAMETVAAVLHVLCRAEGLRDGIEASIRLGGDTDTVAAIVGGILGVGEADPAEALPWLPLVRLPDAALLDRLTAASRRRAPRSA
jgi:ADP-ribosylglycohydrolase